LMSAAGGAAMAKVLLMLSRRTMVPTVNASPAAASEYGTSRLRVVTELEEWPSKVAGTRIAGISCFGAGGTNAHCIVAEAPHHSAPQDLAVRPWVVTFSARTQASLQR